MIEPLEPRQFLANVPNANPIVRPDHVVVVVMQDRFDDAIGDTAHMPYTNQVASTGLVFSNSHGVGHPSEVDTLAEYSGQTFNVTDNGGNYTFATQANLASLLNSTQIAPGQFLSFSGFAESLPHDGDMTTVIANDPNDPKSPPDLYNRRYNPMAQFLNVGTRNGVAVSTAAVNRTFASFPTTAAGFASMPTVSYVIANSVDNGHGSNEQDPYATDPAAYFIHRVNADNWLKNKMDAYLQWAKANNSLLIVTTDEEETDTHPTATITTIVNGDNRLFVPGVNPTSVNHYNMLRTLTDMYGLSPLANAATVGAYTTNALGQLAPQASVATSTTVTSSNASSLWGQDVTFTATVSAASGAPGGTVTFKDGASVLGTGTLNALGIATFTPSSPLSVGSHSITAAYGGSVSFLTSTSAPMVQNVGKAASATSLTASANPTMYEQPVTLTATVSRSSTGTGSPSLLGGGVSFYEGATLLGSASSIDANGVATLSLSSLLPGSHVISAVYDGNTNFTGSGSGSVTQTVNAATTTTVGPSADPSLFGQPVTFSATVSAAVGTPGGSVQFVVDGADFGLPVTLTNGAASSASIATLSAGDHTVSAVYSGAGDYLESTSSSVTQTVTKNATATQLTSNVNPSQSNQSVTFTATVSASDAPAAAGTPSGTVTFFDGTTALATIAVDGNAQAAYSTSSLSIGMHNVTAVYFGDGAFLASTSSAVSQSVGQQSTSTTLGTSVSPSSYGQSVTFTATVTAAVGTPDGSVSFFDGANLLGTTTLDASGSASLSTSVLIAGDHSITVGYAGSTQFQSSASSALTQTVNQAATSVTLGSSTSSPIFGQGITFTASVAVTSPGSVSGLPGNVAFMEGSTVLATIALDSSGQAKLTSSFLAVGSHSIVATFSSTDTNVAGNTSAALSQPVAAASTSTALDSSANPSAQGDSITLTATVSNNSPGSIAPTGTVNFVEGANLLGSASIDSTGVAKFATSALSTGPHTITATYAGNTNFTASTSAPLTQTVNASQPVIVATNTAVASSANPSVTGQSISLAAAVVPVNGIGTPTGTVQFLIDGANFGSPVALVNGSATSASISNLAIGGHTISAVYSGDAAFSASTAPGITQTVNAARTATTLASSLNPSIATQSVTFTAKVNVSAPGAGIPAGTVTFKDGTTTLGTATLDATGQAQFTTSSMSVATHSITAVYGGSTSYLASTSAAVSQQVKAIATPSTVAASDGTFSDRIRITWSAVTTATSYEVWRNTSNNTANATRIAASVTGLTFDDTTAVFGTSYRYWIKAKNSLSTSGFSTSDTGYRASVNNNFANATVITGTTATVTGSNTGASKESGEPNHAGNAGGKSVWWTWTATAAGTVTIDTLGSNFDTLLAVYTGTSVSGLTLVKANDDSLSGGTLTSKVSFTVKAGTTYRIAVDGYGGVSGSITLNLKLV